MKKLLPVAICLLLATVAVGETKLITLTDGTSFVGEVRKTEAGYLVKIERLGATLEREIPEARVASVQAVTTPAEEYREYRAKVNPTDADDFYKLGNWAYERDMFEQSRTDLRKALELNPRHDAAQLLLRIVENQLERQQETDAGEGADEQGSGPGRPVGSLNRLLVSESDINNIRLAELNVREVRGRWRVTDRVAIAIDDAALDAFINYMAGRQEFERDGFDRVFRSWSSLAKAGYMLEHLPETSMIRDGIRVKRDPEFMRRFRRQVWPTVRKVALEVLKREGPSEAQLRVILGRQTDKKAYTTFVILDGTMVGGKPLIDRNDPEESLLLQYGLPEELARYRPAEPLPTLYANRRDSRYQRVREWIGSLKVPHPDYRLNYRPPFGLKIQHAGMSSGPLLPPRDTEPEPEPEPEGEPEPEAPSPESDDGGGQ